MKHPPSFALRDPEGARVTLDGNLDPRIDSVLCVDQLDEASLLVWCEFHQPEVLADDDLSIEDRGRFTHLTLALQVSRLLQHRERFRHMLEFVRTAHFSALFLDRERDALGVVLEMSRGGTTPAARALRTGVVALALAVEGGKSALATRSLLAGMIADVGMTEEQRRLTQLDRVLTPHERNELRTHPSTSAAMLRQIGMQDEAVLDAVAYHHERINGSGYPHGLPGHDLPTLAQVVGLADEFAQLTTDGGTGAVATDISAASILARRAFNTALVDLLARVVGERRAEAA